MVRIELSHFVGVCVLSLFPCNRESRITDRKIFSSTFNDGMRLFGGVKVVVLYRIINGNQAADQHL